MKHVPRTTFLLGEFFLVSIYHYLFPLTHPVWWKSNDRWQYAAGWLSSTNNVHISNKYMEFMLAKMRATKCHSFSHDIRRKYDSMKTFVSRVDMRKSMQKDMKSLSRLESEGDA